MGKLNNLATTISGTISKSILPAKFYFSQEGYCPCCDQQSEFVAYNDWLRDFFICTKCKSLPRERALMVIIEKYYPNWRTLKIHESSPVMRGASKKLMNGCSQYTASQYYPDKDPGEIVNNTINQDLSKQTFENESFDLVITQDVLEHIYDPEKAFAEIARTLRPGGAHIFTVPLVNKHQASEVWATLLDGAPHFLNTPEYHANPVDPEGCPVTMHWGFDIVDFISHHSGLTTKIEHLQDLTMGIRAEYIEVLVSKK